MEENLKATSQRLTFYNDSLLLGYCTEIRANAFTSSNGVVIYTDAIYTEKPDNCKFELRWLNGSIIVLCLTNNFRTVFAISNNYSLITGQDISKK